MSITVCKRKRKIEDWKKEEKCISVHLHYIKAHVIIAETETVTQILGIFADM